MTPRDFEQVREIFHRACELGDGGRADFLRSACAGRDDIRREVEELLALDADGTATTVGDAIGNRLLDAARPAALENRMVGDFRIVRRLGAGGMGIVYEAEQQRPRRRVALKMIRPSLMSPALLRRFEFEAEILGRLRHPGIAQIYDAGTADIDGEAHPYFAMELIVGRPLLEHAAAQQLSTAQRLRLFARVCAAVSVAHQQGIIHRDLKPANILVDDAGQPKVLDFGVARATDGDVQLTQPDGSMNLVGTISHMSPEQVSGAAADIDVRSDVYALGVILYELLSGRMPYELGGRALVDAARTILEVEPHPITRVQPRLDGDIATILGKALHKDKHQRYAGAAELGADLTRYLDDEPIMARAPTARYQLRMFARRNRGLVVSAAIVVMVLIAGIAGTSWQAIKARRAEARAVADKREADRQARIASAVNDFLRRDLLSALDPARQDNRDVTMREVLDEAAERVAGRFVDEPVVKASISMTIGNTYRQLGLLERAIEHLTVAHDLMTRELGPDSRDALISADTLALAYKQQGRYDQAEALYRATLAGKRRVLGSDDFETSVSINNLASALQAQSAYDEAEALFDEALALRRRLLGDDHEETLTVLANLGAVYDAQGRTAEAEAVHREVLHHRRATLGDGHILTAGSMGDLGKVYYAQGRFEEALPLFRESLDIRMARQGEGHIQTLRTMNNLAVTCRELGMTEEAVRWSRLALDNQIAALGATHRDTLVSRYNLAVLLGQIGQNEDAEAEFRSVIADTRADPPGRGFYLGVFLARYGAFLGGIERHDDAIAALEEAIALLEQRLGIDHPRTRSAIEQLVTTCTAADRPAEAAAWRARLEPAPDDAPPDTR